MTATLAGFSESALSIVASVVAGREITVSLSTRLEAPATLVRKSKSIHLDPDRTGLFDVLLMAELARSAGPQPMDDPEAQADAARGRLIARFKGARGLPGCFRHEGHPRVTFDRLDLRPLEDGAGVGGVSSFGLNLRGAESDYDAVFEAVAEGRLPTRTVPELADLQIADLPLDFDGLVADEDTWAWAAEQREAIADAVQSTVRCVQRRAEGLVEFLPTRRPRGSGRYLDARRLARLRVARAAGLPFTPFKGKKVNVQGAFRPDRRLEVLCLDMATARSDRPFRVNSKMAVLLVEAMRRLRIDSAVILFDDRVRSDGYLHVAGLLKDIDDDVGSRTWARLHHIERAGPTEDCASCLSLQLETAGRYLERLIEPRHNQVQLLMVADGAAGPGVDTAAAIEDIGNATARTFERISERFDVEMSIGGLLRAPVRRALPRALRRHFQAY